MLIPGNSLDADATRATWVSSKASVEMVPVAKFSTALS